MLYKEVPQHGGDLGKGDLDWSSEGDSCFVVLLVSCVGVLGGDLDSYWVELYL